jgi:hypothetical protein
VVNNAKTNAKSLFPLADEILILRISLFSVVSSRVVIPMYTGNLNPDWVIYNEAAKVLESEILDISKVGLADIQKAKTEKDIIDKFKDVKMTEFKPISRVNLLKACHEFVKDFELDHVLNGEIVDNPSEIMINHYNNLKSILK